MMVAGFMNHYCHHNIIILFQEYTLTLCHQPQYGKGSYSKLSRVECYGPYSYFELLDKEHDLSFDLISMLDRSCINLH
jgi:hypothetical protein